MIKEIITRDYYFTKATRELELEFNQVNFMELGSSRSDDDDGYENVT